MVPGVIFYILLLPLHIWSYMYLVSVAMVHVINDYYFLQYTVWFRFGSVSVSSICYRPGSVHVRFRFLRFLVDFGSVRLGVWNILHWYLLLFRGRKSKYRLLPARGLLLPARGFMSRGFQRAERAELGKPKLPEIVSACNLSSRNPYLLFSLNSKSNYNFSNQSIGGG